MILVFQYKIKMFLKQFYILLSWQGYRKSLHCLTYPIEATFDYVQVKCSLFSIFCSHIISIIAPLRFFQMSQFLTGQQFPTLIRQSNGTYESIHYFTQLGLHTGCEFTGQLSGCNQTCPLLCPAASQQLSHSDVSAAYRHVHTLQFLASCSQAITSHCSFSGVLKR